MASEVVNEEAKGSYSICSLKLDRDPEMESSRFNRVHLQVRLNQQVSTKRLEGVLSLCDEKGNFDYKDQPWLDAEPMTVTSITYRNSEGKRFDLAWSDYVTLGKPEKIAINLTTRVSVSD